MKNHLFMGVLLVAACSGCNKKAEGQTVAVVNNEEITASELNAEFANANLPSGVDKKEATAKVLQTIIDRRLLAEQARKEGIDRSPEFIAKQRKMNEELLIGMLASRQMDSGKLPSEGEIAAFEAKQPQSFAQREVWKLAQLQFDTPTDPAVLAKISQTKTLDELAAVLTEAHIPFQRTNNQISTNSVPADLYPRLAALPPGDPFIVPNGNRSVASAIVSKEPAPIEGSAARTLAVSMMRRQSGSDMLQQRLKSLRSTAKIEYKQGFGPPK